ncbi:unnamed protein product, partial [Choristocarpus tenellus]
VRGEYLLQAPQEWGGNNTDTACLHMPVVLTNPTSACEQELELGGKVGAEISEGEPVIVLVKRGICTFVEKAKNVQPIVALATGGVTGVSGGDESTGQEVEAGRRAGMGGMILLNTEDVLADMPAGNLLTDDVNIFVAMISQGNGSSIETLLQWGENVRATIAPLGRCPLETTNPVTSENIHKTRREGDTGGRVLVSTSSFGWASFDYHQAMYGPVVHKRAVRVVVADPIDGCDDKAYKVR